MHGNCFEFPAMSDDLRICNLKTSTKLFKLILSISTQNNRCIRCLQ